MIVRGRNLAIGTGQIVQASAVCPAGSSVVSGGYELTPAAGPRPPLATANRPDSGGAWHVTARADGSGGFAVRAYATCLKGYADRTTGHP